MVVGRLAAQIAPILMGKHRPTYTPHIDTGDYVIVTNVNKVVFTGNKWRQKSYRRYSGYPGGQKEEAAWKLFERRPERILELAIQRMMPKNKIGRHMLAKLKLCVGPNHPHQAQQPIPLEALSGRPTPAGAVYVPEPVVKEKKETSPGSRQHLPPNRRRLRLSPRLNRPSRLPRSRRPFRLLRSRRPFRHPRTSMPRRRPSPNRNTPERHGWRSAWLLKSAESGVAVQFESISG